MASEEKKGEVGSKAEDTKPSDEGKAGLDEEDEFEEFEEPDWETPAVNSSDAKLWEEDWDDAGWDDEDQDDSFQKKLKEELERMDKK
mmetsp:Transcript_101686/g.262820  ORF Transcript_101686/g.262820 Transcript_101686/m.262820 type:complete len:87 (+) Transcript_101686:61-321(+)